MDQPVKTELSRMKDIIWQRGLTDPGFCNFVMAPDKLMSYLYPFIIHADQNRAYLLFTTHYSIFRYYHSLL